MEGTGTGTGDAPLPAESTTFRRTDRTHSQVKFTTQGDSAIEVAMRRELAKLVATAPADERAVCRTPTHRERARCGERH